MRESWPVQRERHYCSLVHCVGQQNSWTSHLPHFLAFSYCEECPIICNIETFHWNFVLKCKVQEKSTFEYAWPIRGHNRWICVCDGSRAPGHAVESLVVPPRIICWIATAVGQFRHNILFRPNFSFLKWPDSVFSVSVKNLFRSNTSN